MCPILVQDKKNFLFFQRKTSFFSKNTLDVKNFLHKSCSSLKDLKDHVKPAWFEMNSVWSLVKFHVTEFVFYLGVWFCEWPVSTSFKTDIKLGHNVGNWSVISGWPLNFVDKIQGQFQFFSRILRNFQSLKITGCLAKHVFKIPGFLKF